MIVLLFGPSIFFHSLDLCPDGCVQAASRAEGENANKTILSVKKQRQNLEAPKLDTVLALAAPRDPII